MQDTVEVVINADGKSCTTVNIFGNEPVGLPEDNMFKSEHRRWHKSESERKTYEIEGVCIYPCEVGSLCECLNKYKPGTIHKAQIINNKAVIV